METIKNKIFLVEDSKIISGILKVILEKNGAFEVFTFTNLDDTLSELELNTPKIIVTDYYLDHLENSLNTGGQLAAAVKKTHPNIVILLLTGMETTSSLPPKELQYFDFVLNKNESEVMDNLERQLLTLIHKKL